MAQRVVLANVLSDSNAAADGRKIALLIHKGRHKTRLGPTLTIAVKSATTTVCTSPTRSTYGWCIEKRIGQVTRFHQRSERA